MASASGALRLHLRLPRRSSPLLRPSSLPTLFSFAPLPLPLSSLSASSSSSSSTPIPLLHEEDSGLATLEEPPKPSAAPLPKLAAPTLTIREKKELAAYAHALGKKLKSQQVGKSGVTPSVAASFLESLEANELLKLKIHASCPGELTDVITQLEESTGSVAVGQIGRTVILYRPSVSKMQKKEAQSARKGWNARPAGSAATFKLQKKTPVPRVSGRRNNQSRQA